MARTFGCLAVCLFLALPVSASELDQEFGARTDLKGPVVSDQFDISSVGLLASNENELQTSELDGETPTQACGWRRGFGVNVGFGGFGYPAFGGFNRGFGGFGYGGGFGGFGGYGVRYTSIGLGYGGFGYGSGFGYSRFGGYPGFGFGGGFPGCYW